MGNVTAAHARTHTQPGDERPKQLRGGHLDTAACRRQRLQQGENDSITGGAAQRGPSGGWGRRLEGARGGVGENHENGKNTHTHIHTDVTFVKTTICDYAQPGRSEASGKDCCFTELQPAGGLFTRQCELNENLKVPEEPLFNIHSDATLSPPKNGKSPSFTAVISAVFLIHVPNHTHAVLTFCPL